MLRKTIGRSKLYHFRLLTILSDIQHTANNRPLTYRCANDDTLEVLTPNRFLNPNLETNLIFKDPKQVMPQSMSRKELITSLNIRDKMVEHFRRLWHEDYLLSLNCLYKDLHEAKFVNRIKIDDIVLIKPPAKSRQHWSLGLVIEVIPGPNGKIRSAKLLSGDANNENGERKLKSHSLNHLYPLELNVTHNHCPKELNEVLSDLGSQNIDLDNEFIDLLSSGVEEIGGNSEDLEQSDDSFARADNNDNLIQSDVNRISGNPDTVQSGDSLTSVVPDNTLVPEYESHADYLLSNLLANQEALLDSRSEPDFDVLYDAPIAATSRRSRRIVAQRRLLDDQFVWYK